MAERPRGKQKSQKRSALEHMWIRAGLVLQLHNNKMSIINIVISAEKSTVGQKPPTYSCNGFGNSIIHHVFKCDQRDSIKYTSQLKPLQLFQATIK